MLGDRSALAHGVWLRDSDIELLARSGTTVVHNCSSNLRLAAGVAPLRQLVAAGVGVALGLDDMGIADDDDMFAELRIAHVLQRVRGESEHPRLHAAGLFGLAWDGGARVVGAASAIGRLEPGRRGDVVVLDLQALRAPFAVDDADVWELLVSRAKAAHVDSVIVEGRALMLDRHAPAHRPRRARCRRSPQPPPSRWPGGARGGAWSSELRRRIAEHYQAPAWHAASS